MENSKKEGVMGKFNFSFGFQPKAETTGSTAVLERDTFESSTPKETTVIDKHIDYSKNSTEKNMKHIANIINGLSMREDEESVAVLEEIGTNSSIDAIREMTARGLVRKNTQGAIDIVIRHAGKGINDLSTAVAMSAINELLSLENKEIAMQVLEDTVANCDNETVKDNARSVKALMALCR